MEKIKLDKPTIEALQIAIREAIKKELQLDEEGYDIDEIKTIEVSAWITVFYNRVVEKENP